MRARLPRRLLPPILSVALAAAALSVNAAAPGPAAAGCHYGAWSLTSRTGSFDPDGSETSDRTVATTTVQWRYVYDCSWSITAVEVDWRRINLDVIGYQSYVCCFERWLYSFHVKDPDNASNTGWDVAYPNLRCRSDYCNFATWTDYGNVFIWYSPSAWDPARSPQTRVTCFSCTPSGWGDIHVDYGFVHNRYSVSLETWGGDLTR
jgi:hypothetical protein